MSWQIRAVLRGSFHKEIDAGKRVVAGAVRRAVEKAAQPTLDRLRDDIRANLPRGRRFANVWRMKVYPRPGALSLDAAALLYVRSGRDQHEDMVITAFEQGAHIVAKGKKYLAIPSGYARNLRPRGGRPALMAAVKARYGEMRFVPLRNGHAMLVVAANKLSTRQQRDARRRGASVIRTAGGRRRGPFTEVVMFWLVREARLPKRLSGAAIRAAAVRDFPARFRSVFEHELRVQFARAA